MQIIRFIIAIIMIIFIINSIHAYEKHQRSANIFRERLFDHFLEAQRRAVLFNEAKQSIDDSSSNDDDYQRTFVRRKVVGISDNPF